LSTNRRTVDRLKKPSDSNRLERGSTSGSNLTRKKSQKKFALQGAREGLRKRLWAPSPGRTPAPSRLALPDMSRHPGRRSSVASKTELHTEPDQAPAPARRPRAPGRSGNFSILGAVLEPQSRGVLIRDKLESRGCQWGLPAICVGSVEGDHSDEAAFFRRSRDIEISFSA
jgi:hypothetical protein